MERGRSKIGPSFLGLIAARIDFGDCGGEYRAIGLPTRTIFLVIRAGHSGEWERSHCLQNGHTERACDAGSGCPILGIRAELP